MKFDRIRLSGFKSFVEPTEFHILSGLTGIVGPNGCGKSNLLEAIRWVMGETSPKSMRGSGMDDVIFSGTSSRPARNMAEVAIVVDNSERAAPAQFNDSEQLEVSRRIERESGSAYRINGREVRAKDVQLLFADAATGAHSPALVSQGRIATLIAAKPQNRRAILEEAAGITGLHARRSEAERRLRDAESNLARIEDVLIQMESQKASLKRQARQATRYRNISGDIRKAEGIHLYLKWQICREELAAAESRLKEAEKRTADAAAVMAKLTAKKNEFAEEIGSLRDNEAKAAAALHRLIVERENLDAELERIAARQEELGNLARQIVDDLARRQEDFDDSGEWLDRLAGESEKLEAEIANEETAEKDAAAMLSAAHENASSAEGRYDVRGRELSELRARRDALAQNIERLESRRARLETEKSETAKALNEQEPTEHAPDGVGEAEMEAAERELEKAEDRLTSSEAARLERQDELSEARERLSEARRTLGELDAEATAIARVIGEPSEGAAPVAEALKINEGLELALAAALGSDLDAPVADEDASGWREWAAADDLPDLPDGATALADFVSGVKALHRRLRQVGVVDRSAGAELARELKPGQRLVSREGDLWRWDGFVRLAGDGDTQAARLEQRRRLEELTAAREKAEAAISEAEADFEGAREALNEAHDDEREARAAKGEAERHAAGIRQKFVRLQRQQQEQLSRTAAYREAARRIADDLVDCNEQIDESQAALDGLEDDEALEAALEPLREEVEALRLALADARAKYDGLKLRQDQRRRRLGEIESEREAWIERRERAEGQISALKERGANIEKELSRIAEAPAEVEIRRGTLLDAVEKAETKRNQAADKLAEAETKLTECERELASAQEELSDAREARARADAARENATFRNSDLMEVIDEKFTCQPADLLEEVGVKEGAELPDLEKIETRIERLNRERERLGAVNLRADIELEELTQQIEHLEGECTDLETAIGRLRQGIQSLNREGRERMLSAFTQVDEHFGKLFAFLFDGGRAHLELVESDDPLDAGLEIMASPPGKRLQSLSLLSGGEQTLTAVALIFAVFLTNPAPICVLDEADAALDDANVDRFCNLLEKMVGETGTRFLIATHNAISMARMDRLFGVTMVERGVSRVVSVDLGEAEKMRATA